MSESQKTMQIYVSVNDSEIDACFHPAASHLRAFVSLNVGELSLLMTPEQAAKVAEVAGVAVLQADEHMLRGKAGDGNQ
jgi:hypothetical protein